MLWECLFVNENPRTIRGFFVSIGLAFSLSLQDSHADDARNAADEFDRFGA